MRTTPHTSSRPAQASALALIAIAASACGGDGGETVAPVVRVAVSHEGRTAVARVNGRPVFDDCVARQARAHELDVRAALDECIAFELLAQEAERRGFASHPEVRRVSEREAVRKLLVRGFEPDHDGPEDIPMEVVREAWQNRALRSAYDHPEYRFCHYVRAKVPRKAPRGGPKDREAEARIRRLYRELAGRTLDRKQLGEIVERQRDGYPLQLTQKAYGTPRKGRSDEAFAEALFSIPEIGRVSKPVRTPWGWDVILLTRIAPERRETVEQAADEIRERIFVPWREQAFLDWIQRLSADHDIEVAQNWSERLPQDPLELP